jgi:hypothetical protein
MLVTIVVSGFQRVREPRPFESRKTDGILAVELGGTRVRHQKESRDFSSSEDRSFWRQGVLT